MSRLYSHSLGVGTPLLFVHGWGMSGNIWESVQENLSAHYRVTWVDLPGYGQSPNTIKQQYHLKNLAKELKSLIQEPTVVAGWSLGGMVAMQLAADYPEYVQKLILTASSPQFFASADWPHAMPAETLETFGRDLQNNYRETVLQFLSIQALGSASARDEIRTLKQRVFRDGEPCYEALSKGLDILQSHNLRPDLHRIVSPTLIIAGEKDRLVPLKASETLRSYLPQAQLHCVKRTSHAPFLSHLDEYTDCIRDYLQ